MRVMAEHCERTLSTQEVYELVDETGRKPQCHNISQLPGPTEGEASWLPDGNLGQRSSPLMAQLSIDTGQSVAVNW